MSATIRAHDQLIQTLRLRIAKLKKQAFGKSSEKVEREIEQLELALEDLLIAAAESTAVPADDDVADDASADANKDATERKPRRRPRVSDTTPRERRELDPGTCCPDCGGDLRLVGEDVSDMLDLVAAQLKVLQIVRLKKSCRRCESSRANAIRPREPENGAGTCLQQRSSGKPSPGWFPVPPHPWQHGERGAAGLHSGLEMRRSYSAVSPERNLRAHGMSHCTPLVQEQWRMIFQTARWSTGAGAR